MNPMILTPSSVRTQWNQARVSAKELILKFRKLQPWRKQYVRHEEPQKEMSERRGTIHILKVMVSR